MNFQEDPADGSVSTSVSMLMRAIDQDAEAWNRILSLYGPLVYQWARKVLQANDASDIVQEVFLKVNKKLSDFDHASERSSFRGWLRTITRNTALDLVRRQKREGVPKGGSDAHVELQQMVDNIGAVFDDETDKESELLGLLRRAMEVVKGDFKPKVWTAFYETVIKGRDTKEVADELGVSTGYVRNARYRVQKRIKEELGDLGDFDP